jgi:CheY-like chemotaxis protein
MPDGGLLTIDTDDVVVDADYASARPGLIPGRYAQLRVSDTGEGMPPKIVERAFEPFFTTKPKGEGSGLGLATVYGIITQGGGQCRVYSEPGIGTAFTVLLPATDERPEEAESHRADVHSDGGATVLVVEDEELMLEVTTRILERNAYHVLSASGGQEALDVTASHDGVIDLLLTDVVMPRMLGKEVAERVRALRPGIRVLYMSGYARPVLGERGTLDPGVLLIDKPFSEAKLLAKVREVLDAGAPGA